MLRALTSTLLLLLIAQPLPAQQEPPEDLFNYSSRDLAFRVPPEFQLVAQNRKYLIPPHMKFRDFSVSGSTARMALL